MFIYCFANERGVESRNFLRLQYVSVLIHCVLTMCYYRRVVFIPFILSYCIQKVFWYFLYIYVSYLRFLADVYKIRQLVRQLSVVVSSAVASLQAINLHAPFH